MYLPIPSESLSVTPETERSKDPESRILTLISKKVYIYIYIYI